jgi:hypothetical protein
MAPATTSSDWHPFDRGATVGTTGSEGGRIVCDEEHPAGVRVTLEEGGHTPWSITCGVYGLMVHTIFFSEANEAQPAWERIKGELLRVAQGAEVPAVFVERWQ